MTLDNVACNQCGAPLAIPDAAKFVSCNHCGANLAVRRNESVTYTERIDKIARTTSHLAEQVAQLRYENELARIDRLWEKERETHQIKTGYGTREPAEAEGLIVGLVFCGLGLMSVVIGVPANQLALGIIFGVALITAGVLLGYMAQARFRSYEVAQAAHRARRARVRREDFLPADRELDAAREQGVLNDQELIRILTEKPS